MRNKDGIMVLANFKWMEESYTKANLQKDSFMDKENCSIPMYNNNMI